MKKLKLKAIAILLSSGMAGGAYADMHMDNSTNSQNGKPADTQAHTTDASLTNDVKTAVSDQYADKVNVSTRDGVIYLAGELPSDTDYEKVIVMANSVKGVQDVNVDALTVKESKNPLYDTYLTAKVKGMLIQKDMMGKDIPSWTLGVETKNGVVYLSGTVASEENKQKVMEIAKSVQGVTSVEDKTQVMTDSDETSTMQPQTTDNLKQSNGEEMNQNKEQDNINSNNDNNTTSY